MRMSRSLTHWVEYHTYYLYTVRYSTDIWFRRRRDETCGGWVVKKPKDLSSSEGEECEHGEGVGVYATLTQSDTL